ncbi:MAG: hypothetical protein H7841_04075 [Magnetospirillum sp. WYHS-4]
MTVHRIGKHTIRLPRSRFHRQLMGWSLVTGGIMGFLPILGFWMLPLGLVVLSIDSPRMRRVRRRLSVRWGRWNGNGGNGAKKGVGKGGDSV